ncbi:hypothetical protein N9937_01425, partial [bacterium]|nr:hypothetical protein [bacterium]
LASTVAPTDSEADVAFELGVSVSATADVSVPLSQSLTVIYGSTLSSDLTDIYSSFVGSHRALSYGDEISVALTSEYALMPTLSASRAELYEPSDTVVTDSSRAYGLLNLNPVDADLTEYWSLPVEATAVTINVYTS